MNLQKINKKIEKQKNKLSDLFRMRDGMLNSNQKKEKEEERRGGRKNSGAVGSRKAGGDTVFLYACQSNLLFRKKKSERIFGTGRN